MLTGHHRREQGASLIELLVGVAVLALLLGLAAPSFTQFIQNTQIRTAAEAVSTGITLAKTEALRRNTAVRFQLVSSLEDDCILASNGNNWVISTEDPTGKCGAAAGADVTPFIVQKRGGADGAPNADVLATGGGAGNHTLVFTGLGRPSSMNLDGFTTVDITNDVSGTCEHASASGTMRCLRIAVTPGGDARMCDPKVSDATDPRKC